MNKEQKKMCKVIDKAFSQLHILSNITWTPYRDVIFDFNKKDEKQHRTGSWLEHHPDTMSVNICAKMFTVKHIAENLLQVEKWKIKDLLTIRKSCLYAQSVVENYRDEILKAWKDQDLKYLANLDYLALVDWNFYTEQKERKIA